VKKTFTGAIFLLFFGVLMGAACPPTGSICCPAPEDMSMPVVNRIDLGNHRFGYLYFRSQSHEEVFFAGGMRLDYGDTEWKQCIAWQNAIVARNIYKVVSILDELTAARRKEVLNYRALSLVLMTTDCESFVLNFISVLTRWLSNEEMKEVLLEKDWTGTDVLDIAKAKKFLIVCIKVSKLLGDKEAEVDFYGLLLARMAAIDVCRSLQPFEKRHRDFLRGPLGSV
jgi:hypothetical protein